jgi:transmembrane sensor
MDNHQPEYDPKALADKWLKGTISEDEKAYFEKWYNHFDFSTITEEDTTFRQRVFNRLQQEIMPNRRIIPMVIRWSAAAAVVGILVTGYLLLQKPPVAEKPILPGGNKAVLTLSDGSTIALDSAVNGAIAQQGSTQIVKLKNGELAYKADDHHPAIVQYNTISTPRGGWYRITLPDGTGVWLNAASSLKYPAAFTGSERQVTLTGEAYFEVADDAAQPFSVKANGITVHVLGTHFNINAYDDENAVKATLVTGRVKVTSGDHESILSPGQMAIVNSNQTSINTITTDTDEEIAWKNGLFQFNNTNIAAVMRQISRWYNVSISYEGTITDNSFTGSISRDADITKVLKLLELTGGVHFKVTGQNITVIP